ncbi:DoxX family protein [Vallicoccus soli]|uniref:DoxX family protein n=1 Tax=Vallicoccus soli TaxID=2339232 RepID=A0A3A3YP21_9ACTN|nr:DoxX family protein [Vallicoccus soli]RJK92930.1 hypothetical protein D5H78_17575 [Vallicoccus soli]
MRAERCALALAALLTTTGVLHFAAPRPFASIVPRALGDPRPWVRGSGAAELACAAGLLAPGTRRRAGWATAALLLAVWPANWQMALASGDRSAAYRTAAWGRLPLQLPLVAWALRVARG